MLRAAASKTPGRATRVLRTAEPAKGKWGVSLEMNLGCGKRPWGGARTQSNADSTVTIREHPEIQRDEILG